MANQQLIQAAQQAIQDKEFNAWLQGIGSKGQEQIKKLFLETAKKDQKLAAMAKEDPESTNRLKNLKIKTNRKVQNRKLQNQKEKNQKK